MKILNLFAGIGGNRTLWGEDHEITAIELVPSIANIYQKRFPNDQVFITDAYGYLEKSYEEFDFIWASPPCLTHTRNISFPQAIKRLPDLRLYSIIIFLKKFFEGFWVVENVIPHYEALIKPIAIVDRHYIWSNYPIENKKFEKPEGHLKNLTKEVLCDFLNIDHDLIKDFNPKNWRSHDAKRNLLRNCVIPAAGKYILESIKTITLDKFTNKTI